MARSLSAAPAFCMWLWNDRLQMVPLFFCCLFSRNFSRLRPRSYLWSITHHRFPEELMVRFLPWFRGVKPAEMDPAKKGSLSVFQQCALYGFNAKVDVFYCTVKLFRVEIDKCKVRTNFYFCSHVCLSWPFVTGKVKIGLLQQLQNAPLVSYWGRPFICWLLVWFVHGWDDESTLRLILCARPCQQVFMGLLGDSAGLSATLLPLKK